LLGTPTALHAIILIGSDNPTTNTTAPTGDLANSGWDLQGNWGSFLGTPIAPNYFITAKHVGGSVGGTFTLAGQNYTTTAKFQTADSDLTVWKINGSFPTYAPLYTTSYTFGQDIIMFGRGTQRGAEVVANSELKGWLWGSADGVKRWGRNDLSSLIDGGAGLGPVLTANFDYAAGSNEGTFSTGDSGGGVFVQDGGIWKLAAINYGVISAFKQTADGPLQNGAIFDAGGLYFGENLITDGTVNVPTYSVFTPIAVHSDWILTTVPEPATTSAFVALSLATWTALTRRNRPPLITLNS